jgi:hypothetical protein
MAKKSETLIVVCDSRHNPIEVTLCPIEAEKLVAHFDRIDPDSANHYPRLATWIHPKRAESRPKPRGKRRNAPKVWDVDSQQGGSDAL